MKHDGISVTAVIVLAAFVIERLAAALLFLLSFSGKWRTTFPDPATCRESAETAKAQRRSTLMWFLVASALVIVTLVKFPEILVLQALGISAEYPVDFVVSWLILLAGSERVAALLASDVGQSDSASSDTHKVRGEVRVVEETQHTTSAAGR